MAAVAGKTESRTARFSAGPRHGTRQGPGRRRPRGPSAGEEGKPPVGCVSAGRRQSRSLRQQSHPARFVAGAGNLWHAYAHKGSPLFRRRAPARNTLGPRGLLTARLAASRREAPHGRSKTHRSREWRWARFGSNDLLAPSPDAGQTGRAHRCRRRRALWSPARCGTFASPPVKWPARQGEARIRTHWRQRAACAVRCAGPSGTRSAACPCSPGSASRTRTRRSCPCAAASVRRTAGRPAPAAA